MRRTLLTTAVGIGVLLAAPSIAAGSTQTARRGKVSATFSYQKTSTGFKDLKLKIARAGRVLYNAPVHSHFCGSSCWPLLPQPHRSSVQVLDLESNGNDEVVLSLYTGGAHCCEVEQVFRPSAAGTGYAKVEHNFGNAGDVIKDLDHNGHLEFVGVDDAFFYEFTSFAFSGAPIQIWRFFQGRFAVVTRNYPAEIKQNAARWWKAFTQSYSNGDGLIAAWAADEDLLGNFSLVKSRLESELHKGHLQGGSTFIAHLHKFLRKRGYEG